MNNLSGNIRIKKKLSPKHKKSPLSEKYKQFLKGGHNHKSHKSPKKVIKVDKQVVQVVKLTSKPPKKNGTPKNNGALKKNESHKKNDSPKKNEALKKNEAPKKIGTPNKKIINIKSKGNPLHKKVNRYKKKSNIRRSNTRKSNCNSNPKNKLHKKHTRSRRVSLRCSPKNKKKNMDKILKSVNKLSEDEMKKQLKKKGIDIKSNNKSLLKDIYLFSSLGGIRIHKE